MLGRIKLLTIAAKPALWSIAVLVLPGGMVLFTMVWIFRNVRPLVLNKLGEWPKPDAAKFWRSPKAYQFRKAVLG